MHGTPPHTWHTAKENHQKTFFFVPLSRALRFFNGGLVRAITSSRGRLGRFSPGAAAAASSGLLREAASAATVKMHSAEENNKRNEPYSKEGRGRGKRIVYR